MAPEKTTIMVLKVDLDCTKCCLKVKRLLCRYDEIRDQIFNEKTNTVTITVVCCSPEKIRDKLAYKGRGTIKSIDIKEPEKPKPVEKPPAAAPKPVEKPPAAAPKPVEKPPADKPQEKPKSVVFVEPPVDKPQEKPKTVVVVEPLKPALKAPAEPAQKAVEPVVVAGYVAYPTPYGMSYEGGPCYTGYGVPMQPPPCNCGCGRLVCYDGYGRGGGYTGNRCDYFSEESSSGCTVM